MGNQPGSEPAGSAQSKHKKQPVIPVHTGYSVCQFVFPLLSLGLDMLNKTEAHPTSKLSEKEKKKPTIGLGEIGGILGNPLWVCLEP